MIPGMGCNMILQQRKSYDSQPDEIIEQHGEIIAP